MYWNALNSLQVSYYVEAKLDWDVFTGIDLFDQNVIMACAKVRLSCTWISLVLRLS